jgi:hypothetical protein
VLWTGRASEDRWAVLTPLVGDFEAGKLRFKRSGRYGDGANRWEIVEHWTRRFSNSLPEFVKVLVGVARVHLAILVGLPSRALGR